MGFMCTHSHTHLTMGIAPWGGQLLSDLQPPQLTAAHCLCVCLSNQPLTNTSARLGISAMEPEKPERVSKLKIQIGVKIGERKEQKIKYREVG